uniref:Putative 40-residue YVTN family beta-propeller repeat protein n=1 Tax=mine drainage metagenome TaxID=410659 RepID=E6Q6H5_9ZZZZ
MWYRAILAAALFGLACTAAAPPARHRLPNSWHLRPVGSSVGVGTMPQGIALSPGGQRIAVLDAGAAPATLRVLDTRSLETQSIVKLPDGFGNPIWLDDYTVLVAGGKSDEIERVDLRSRNVLGIDTLGRGSWCAGIALSVHHTRLAAIGDRNGRVVAFDLHGRRLWSATVGAHPSALAFEANGTLVVASRQDSKIYFFNRFGKLVESLATDTHPAALAIAPDGRTLAVAASDAGRIDLFSTQSPERELARVVVAERFGVGNHFGSSPDALAFEGNASLLVALAGENQIALVRKHRVVARIPVGWYPDALAASRNEIYVADGKGDGMHANPTFRPLERKTYTRYVAILTSGDLRRISRTAFDAPDARNFRAERATILPLANRPATSVLRADGPIRHVIYIIKENRTYDQVLGDIKRANGDPQLAWFGERVTPNQHAIARRFGILDNAYTDAQVSADGHNWTDAAFANDYVERFWPPNYGGRRPLYDFQNGASPVVPQGGYLWDDALRFGISFRDYGEDTGVPRSTSPTYLAGNMHGLIGHFDPAYEGWNLQYSDLLREAEWKREFRAFVAHHDLPALEIVYFPNDHTEAARAGALTPKAYVAQNDLAVGRLVDAVSHSRYWRSTAIFVVEDDAQNGPDHVSDQRSTFYVASPYARGGVVSQRYDTASVLRSIELVLGLPPLSIYDATARPLDAAFTARPNLAPFSALAPTTDLHARNPRHGIGARRSAAMDFRIPDAADPTIANDVLWNLYGVKQ